MKTTHTHLGEVDVEDMIFLLAEIAHQLDRIANCLEKETPALKVSTEEVK